MHSTEMRKFGFTMGAVIVTLFGLLLPWLLDRLGTHRLIQWVQLPMALGFLLFSLGDALWLTLLGMVFFGIGSEQGDALLMSAHDVGQGSDPVGVGDGGAAELHHDHGRLPRRGIRSREASSSALSRVPPVRR